MKASNSFAPKVNDNSEMGEKIFGRALVLSLTQIVLSSTWERRKN